MEDGMFCTPNVKRTAVKEHLCTYCGQKILKGEVYATWKSCEDSWFTNKMHFECADDQDEWGDGEYLPYVNDRPQEPKL
jgi:hypothetical protein